MIDYDYHHRGLAFTLVAVAFVTAGIIMAATLAASGPGTPTAAGGFLFVVGLPIAMMMAIAVLVCFLMMQFIMGLSR